MKKMIYPLRLDKMFYPTAHNKWVSGFGLRLCLNPRYARTSDTRNTLSEIPDAPRLEIEGENNGIGIPKPK